VTDALVARIVDHLERVPCNMPQEEFVARYVMHRGQLQCFLACTGQVDA